MMILPTGAIHLLDRLKFRFQEDHGIDGRLIDGFMSSKSAKEAAVNILAFLETSLEAKDLFWWEKSASDSYRLIATSKGDDVPDVRLPEPFRRVSLRHFIRFESISADWQDSIQSLYGSAQSDVGAIDIWQNESHLLLIVWNETAPSHAPDDPAFALLEAAAALDDVPVSLQRVVRAPNGRTYHLPALLALHRMHDEQTAIRQSNAIRLATEWLAKDDPERKTVVAMIRIQNVGTILAPRFVLTKHKRSKDEIELIEEAVAGSTDLLEVFGLTPQLVPVMNWQTRSHELPMSFAASIALSAWQCANSKTPGHRKKVRGPLVKLLDSKVKSILKAKHLV